LNTGTAAGIGTGDGKYIGFRVVWLSRHHAVPGSRVLLFCHTARKQVLVRGCEISRKWQDFHVFWRIASVMDFS
jgi:hypothetical protein